MLDDIHMTSHLVGCRSEPEHSQFRDSCVREGLARTVSRGDEEKAAAAIDEWIKGPGSIDRSADRIVG